MKANPPKPPFRVQIICETNLEHFKNIRLGIRHYSFTTKRIEVVEDWFSSVIYDPATRHSLYPVSSFKMYSEYPQIPLGLTENIRKNRIDGIIAQIRDKELMDILIKLSIPVVDIGNRFTESPFPVVAQDPRLIGRQAAEHLISCGCAAFAFWGQENATYSTSIQQAFRENLFRQYPGKPQLFEANGDSILVESGDRLIQRMSRWLRKLAFPIGIFTVLDTFALHLMQAAQKIGLRVPEDVAILASGDDAYWTEFGNVPLSSIHYNSKKIGFESAMLLDKMISEGRRNMSNRYIAGSEVSARRSTDILFTKDPMITKAVTYIRKNANRNIYVDEVAKAAGISRTGLHLHFKKVLGHSVLQEIRNARIRYVQFLLRTSNLQLTEIAEACDFPDSPAMHALFRRVTGETPGKYRAMFRQF